MLTSCQQVIEKLNINIELFFENLENVQPDANARYEVVDRVLAEIKRSGVTKMGFVGNEQYGNF
ncbi:ExbD/TolR family protein [Nostoc linckia]|uniref:ExbD/TolR family protein n=1 Tax=Nostoc linckia TaxID=92942 RepID=UPI001C5586A4|nr:hypothetical protein [Nostoc linckia]